MKKILFFGFLIASVLIIKNFLTSIYTLWQKQDLTTQAQIELKKELKKNKEYKEKLFEAEDPHFVEKEARNKLFLVKEGEQEIVISDALLEKKPGSKSVTSEPNWKKWWRLFIQ